MTTLEYGKSVLDVNDLMQLLPHRFPFLLVDRLIDIVPEKGATGIKNVSYGDFFFQGHFPQKPVMPGVLIIEAMAQSAAAYTSYTEKLDVEDRIVLFMGIDKARFRAPVVPGDRLCISVKTVMRRKPVWRFSSEATVGDKKVAEATYSAMLAAAF